MSRKHFYVFYSKFYTYQLLSFSILKKKHKFWREKKCKEVSLFSNSTANLPSPIFQKKSTLPKNLLLVLEKCYYFNRILRQIFYLVEKNVRRQKVHVYRFSCNWQLNAHIECIIFFPCIKYGRKYKCQIASMKSKSAVKVSEIMCKGAGDSQLDFFYKLFLIWIISCMVTNLLSCSSCM